MAWWIMMVEEYVPLLIAQTGPAAGQRWALNKDELLIGREPECDICIPDRQVSRAHARLRRLANGFELEDLGSKNGTHINGAPVQGKILLQDGDVVQVALVARLAYVGSDATMPLRADSAMAAALGLKRTAPLGATNPGSGRLRLDSAARRVWVAEAEVEPPLSAPQFRFLELLYENAGRVCTREEVINAVWPDEAGAGVTEQAIDALVRRVRDRLAELDPEHQYVATVRGHGFRLDNVAEGEN
ncbi:MAG: FHA domain-containing protein [Anaerolineales bacterium]|nr:FHA domain-containing protein [Anaerolineales bacterium]